MSDTEYDMYEAASEQLKDLQQYCASNEHWIKVSKYAWILTYKLYFPQ
jgi:hypothetical protein